MIVRGRGLRRGLGLRAVWGVENRSDRIVKGCVHFRPVATLDIAMDDPTPRKMTGRWALVFLGIACAVGVASIYYNQPLLLVMGSSFGKGAQAMGFVAVATQVGYAGGLLFLVPLGDVTERRGLMARMYGGVAAALVLAAAAQSLAWLIGASVLIGLMASVTHVALPMAPDLVPHERRGHAIGSVMTGLLLGVLLARTFAGWLARLSSWRVVFLVAAGMNLAFVPIVLWAMPRVQVREKLSYGQAMRSLWTLARTKPLLREASMLGALTFGSFSCFWTTLAFMLEGHHHLGPAMAGTFGLVGAAGAFIAPLAGRLADRRGTRVVVTVAGIVLTGSYLWLWLVEKPAMSLGEHLALLFVGVIALDIGAQMMQIGNQTRIFGLGAAERGRLNTIYMTMYFAGGAVGSALASQAWSRWGWDGVCGLALLLVGLAGLVHATGYSRTHAEARVAVPRGEQEPA
jgi:predicted MFS family arabinose efflux permease